MALSQCSTRSRRPSVGLWAAATSPAARMCGSAVRRRSSVAMPPAPGVAEEVRVRHDAHRHDHRVGLEPVAVGQHRETAAGPLDRADGDAGAEVDALPEVQVEEVAAERVPEHPLQRQRSRARGRSRGGPRHARRPRSRGRSSRRRRSPTPARASASRSRSASGRVRRVCTSGRSAPGIGSRRGRAPVATSRSSYATCSPVAVSTRRWSRSTAIGPVPSLRSTSCSAYQPRVVDAQLVRPCPAGRSSTGPAARTAAPARRRSA